MKVNNYSNPNLFFITILTLLLNSPLTYAQDKLPQLEQIEYSCDPSTQEIHYIILLVDEAKIDVAIKDVKKTIEEKGISQVQVKKFAIEDLKKGRTPYIIIRRFNSDSEAKSLIDKLVVQPNSEKYTPLTISQSNYRKFLRKRDIQGYITFIENL